MKSVLHLIAVLALVSALENACYGQEGIKWHDDVEAARAQAAREGKLVLIHFWNERCGPCKKLDVTVFPDESVAAAVHRSYVPVKVNTDRNRALTASLKVDRIPQDVLMTADGNVLTKQISPNRANLYVNFVNSVASYAQAQRPQSNQIAQASAETSASPQQHPLEQRRFGSVQSDRDSVPVIPRGQIDPRRELAESPANPTNFQITDRAGPTERGAALANQTGQGFNYPQMPQSPNRAIETSATNLASRQPPIYTSQLAPRRWDGQATSSPDAPNFERPTAPTGPTQSFPEQATVGNPYAEQQTAQRSGPDAQNSQTRNQPLDLRNPSANVPYQGQRQVNQPSNTSNSNVPQTYNNPTIQQDLNRAPRTFQSPESFRQNAPLASNQRVAPNSNAQQRPITQNTQQGSTPDPRVIRANGQGLRQPNGFDPNNFQNAPPQSGFPNQTQTNDARTQRGVSPEPTIRTPDGITPGYGRAPLDESNPYRRTQPNLNPSHLPPQQVPSNHGINERQHELAIPTQRPQNAQLPAQPQTYRPTQPEQNTIPIVTGDQYRTSQNQPLVQPQATQPRAPQQGGVSLNSNDLGNNSQNRVLTPPANQLPRQPQFDPSQYNQPRNQSPQIQQPSNPQRSPQQSLPQQPNIQRPNQGLVQPNQQQSLSPAIGANRPASIPQQNPRELAGASAGSGQSAPQSQDPLRNEPPVQQRQEPQTPIIQQPATQQGGSQQQTLQQPTAQQPAESAPIQSQSTPELPSVAMDGFCPVTLVEHRSWRKGEQAHGCIHRGRLYLFTSAENRDRFLAHPDRFAPMLSGYDPVIYAEENRLVEGKREHGVFSGGRVYMFANEDTLIAFRDKVDFYSARSFEAMGLPMERMAEESDGEEVNR